MPRVAFVKSYKAALNPDLLPHRGFTNVDFPVNLWNLRMFRGKPYILPPSQKGGPSPAGQITSERWKGLETPFNFMIK